jgi:hypothetical protein
VSSPTQQTTPLAGRLDADGRIAFGAGTLDGYEVEARRGEPPAQVIEQIAHAGEIHRRLRASGLRIDFDLTAQGPAIRLRGADGETLRCLSISETAEIALGTAQA